MKRFSTLLILAFNRMGFAVFTVYYALFFMSILTIFPRQWMQGLASVVDPYYASIRMIGFVASFLMCLMIFRFLTKYLQYELYPIKRKTLSFVLALCLVQLLSFFCYNNLPVEYITVTEQLESLQAVFIGYKLYLLELVALCLSGYLLAFYVGTLSRSKFSTDVVLAPKKPKK